VHAALQNALKATSVALDRTVDPLLVLPDGSDARVVEAMRYSFLSPGKRLRPFLVLAAAELFDVPRARAMRVAAAVEFIHCYSLIHDDLPAMDDDDIRRGRPTVHIAFDEATAILAGDAFQSLAYEVLSGEATHPDPGVRIALVGLLARASGHHGMVGGQMIDILAAGRGLSESEIYRLQQMKTGALIAFGPEAGAVLGGASDKDKQSLLGYARDLGLAFQIADDLLDVEGDPTVMGKATNKDATAGKATLVAIIGLDRAREQARILSQQAIDHLQAFGEKADLLRAVAHFAVDRDR